MMKSNDPDRPVTAGRVIGGYSNLRELKTSKFYMVSSDFSDSKLKDFYGVMVS